MHKGFTIVTVLTLAAGIAGAYLLADQHSESRTNGLRADFEKIVSSLISNLKGSAAAAVPTIIVNVTVTETGPRTAPSIKVDNSWSHGGTQLPSNDDLVDRRIETNTIPILPIGNSEQAPQGVPRLVTVSTYPGQTHLKVRSSGNSRIDNVVGKVPRGAQLQVIGSTISDERNSIWYEVACGSAVECTQFGGHHYIPSFQTDKRMEYP